MNQQKVKSTTQQFTEIHDIANDLLIFKGGNASMVLEVSAVNFYLLSSEEQQSKLYSFVSFLNSLSFAIQILIVSKHVDISSYLQVIEQRKAVENRPKILEHLQLYKEFIENLMKARTLLDKKFYIVIPFSHLELGPLKDTKQFVSKNNQAATSQMESILTNKKVAVATQLQRMGLSCKQLATQELIKLMHELYNQEELRVEFQSNDMKNVII